MSDTEPTTAIETFSFGDALPVLDGRNLLDFLEYNFNGKWYEPPMSLEGLSKVTRSNVYLQSGLIFKRNMLARSFKPHRLLTREAFEQLALDFVTFGMAYLERRDAVTRQPLELKPALAKYMRRGEDDRYFMIRGFTEDHAFMGGSIYQLRDSDVDQEIYGTPEWAASMQSALLNESATLFRRRYYTNGAHAGFILYLNDAANNEEDITALRTALKNARGPGNFRNLFVYAPGGKKDGLQLIPVSEVAAKDQFDTIKGVTRDDMLAALRIPPQLMGIVPDNAGGFGNVRDAAAVWAEHELAPLQSRMQKINDWVGDEVIRFEPLAP